MFYRSIFTTLFVIGTRIGLSAASISGVISDERNALNIESASVTLVQRETTIYSERGGQYRFRNLPPGTYTVRVEAIGYPTKYEQVEIADEHDVVTANIFLNQVDEDEVVELEAFVVEGTAIGLAKSLNIRKSAEELRDVISSDAFGQFADRNPAEALQRVAGVAVEDDQGEGSFLLVRGASADLSNVQIDGVALATPQEDGRKVNLNVITVDQLERIELSKTWLPYQKPVIGGTIDMKTRSALDRGGSFASIELAGTYRDIAPDETSYRSALTLGTVLDKEDNAIFGNVAIGFQISYNQSENYSGSDTVDWGYDGQVTFPHATGQNEEFLAGFVMHSMYLRDYNITRERTGVSSQLEVKLGERHKLFFSISDNTFDDEEAMNIFRMRAYVNDAHDWGGYDRLTPEVAGLLNYDLTDPDVVARMNPPQPVTFNESIALGELGYDPENFLFTNSTWRIEGWRGFRYTVREDNISTYQTGGVHELASWLDFDWKIFESEATQDSERWEMHFTTSSVAGKGYTLAGRDYPDPMLYPVNEDANDDGIIDRLDPRIMNITEGSGANRINRIFDSEDKRDGYEANLRAEAEWGPFRLVTRGGVSEESREKAYHIDYNTSRLDQHGLDGTDWNDTTLLMSDEIFLGDDVEGFEDNFNPYFNFGPGFKFNTSLDFAEDPSAYGVLFIQDANDLNTNFTEKVLTDYDATEDITGYYLQQSVEWRKWTLIFGARLEETENTFTNLEIVTRPEDREMFEGVTLPAFIAPSSWRLLRQRGFEAAFSQTVVNSRKYDHLLPAIHLRRQFGENLDVRMAFTKTIGRPLFSDLIPREIIDISDGDFQRELRLPAFNLQPLESKNYDISFDYYFEQVGLISLGLFYKEIDGAIYDETRTAVIDDTTYEYDFKYDPRGNEPSRHLPWNLTQKRNSGAGKLMGVEVTFDRKLNFLSDWLDGFGVNSNIAFFDSEATLTTASREGEIVSLFGQPSMTANFSLYYNKHNVFARVSWNRRGEYIRSISTDTRLLDDVGNSARDTYVGASERLDLTIRYNLTESFQIFFEGINLLNEPLVWYMNSPVFPLKKQYTEPVYTIGAKWNY